MKHLKKSGNLVGMRSNIKSSGSVEREGELPRERARVDLAFKLI
jgi:hypothetical protein